MALIEFENYPSTNTPISADNLNNNFKELEDNITTLQNPSIASAYRNGSTFTAPSNSTTPCSLDTFSTNVGGFELSDDGVKVPKDGTVLVIAGAMFSPRTSYCGITLRNGTTFIADVYEPYGNNNYGVINLSGVITQVSAGDVLKLCISSNNGTDVVQNSTRTCLTIIYLTA